MGTREDTWGRVPPLPGGVLQEDALTLQLHEELPTCNKEAVSRAPLVRAPPTPRTAEALQDEVELAARLEGVDEVNDEGVLDGLQDVPLSPRVRRVLGIAGDLSLGWGGLHGEGMASHSDGGGGVPQRRRALWHLPTFFSTFMAKIFPVLVPCTLRTWKTCGAAGANVLTPPAT